MFCSVNHLDSPLLFPKHIFCLLLYRIPDFLQCTIVLKKFLLFILVLVIIAGVCVVTCPDKAAHCKALKDVLNTVLTEELSSDESDADLVMFGSMIGTGLGGLVIDNMLKVDNYFVCSVGTITYDGETKVVSVGVLNHIFTPDKEDLKKAAEMQ